MGERLLTIDVEAALAKVSMGRLRSAAQVPLALVRVMAAAEPGRVRVGLRRNRIEVEHDGVPPGPEVLEQLEVLLDRDQDDLERHLALERLEEMSMLDLLVAFFGGARMVILQAGPPTNLRLVARPGGKVAGIRQAAGAGTSLVVNGNAGQTSEQAAELEEHLRFAHFRVELNGRRIDRGLHLEDALMQRSFEQGEFAGLVGLPRAGLAARTRVVVHGVMVRQVWDSPPSGAVWDAVVRCPADGQARALALVSEQVAGLYRRVSEGYGELSDADRARVELLLFRLADHGASAAVVAGVPMFRTVEGDRVCAAELRRAALGRVVRAIGPEASPGRYEIDGPVFVLHERQREFVERHLGLLVREPGRRPTPRGRLQAWLGDLTERAGRAVRRLVRRLMATREVPPERLDPEEAGFGRALQEALDDGLVPDRRGARVRFIRAGLVDWRWMDGADGKPRLLLGRANGRVRAMVHAFAAQPAALYPALMLLLDGQDAFGRKREQAAGQLAGLTPEE